VITLKDEPECASAVDCMVSYFYNAGYNASKYDTSEALVYAQVAILADKYDCASLYKLTIEAFAHTVKAVEGDDWSVIAAFIYDYTTMESPAHVEIRNIVVTTVTSRHSMFDSTLRNENIVDLLRSNADLATDLLLGGAHGPKAKEVFMFHFTCEHCHYSHSGMSNCPDITSNDGDCTRVCPQCWKKSGKVSQYILKVGSYRAFPCKSCDGFQTLEA
jgi:hypothetical protein